MLRKVTVRHAPASAGQVRRQLDSDLTDAGLPAAVVGDATLVVSELVGNSVRYAAPLPGGVLQVTWSVNAECVRLRVSDGGGSSVPARHDAGPQDVRGRGLAIVAALASDWGVELSNGAGPVSTVWVDLPVEG